MGFAIVGILLVALMIPIFGIVVDSPIGRAIARRLEGPDSGPAPSMINLAKKVDLLEGEVDDLHRAVDSLKEANQFLQRLLEESPNRPVLPPGSPQAP
ncbi:MAG: hypothetical protein E4G90_10640 [Gemmatimonadales bacterium]|nr:MAG: hypothetical protein E4G90_10640 [Gemmatimonadales bacterium]